MELAKEKRGRFCTVWFAKGNFFSIFVLSQCFVYWIHFQITFARSSHQRCSVKKVVLRNLSKFTGKHLCQSLFFNKAAHLTEHLFHRTPLGDCFCFAYQKTLFYILFCLFFKSSKIFSVSLRWNKKHFSSFSKGFQWIK